MYNGILALIFSMAVFATVIYRFLTKKDCMIYMFIFYAVILYGVISFVKMVLGEPNLTLFDSFLDMETVTYIHYGVPLLVLMVIVPFLHGRFLKEEFSSRFVMAFNFQALGLNPPPLGGQALAVLQ